MSAVEMQRIPKFGCMNKAYKIRTQGQAATIMPQNYVPLRGKSKLFFSDEERERYEREKREKREKTRINLHRLRLSRALLYSSIALIHAAIIALIIVSFSLGSRNVWEALFQIPSWLSLILIVIYFTHCLRYRMFQSIKLRNFVVYSTLLVFSLTSSTLFTFRIQNGLMCRDFAGLEPHSCCVPQFLVVISWVAVVLCFGGILLNYHFTQLGRPEEQIPQLLHDPFRDCIILRSHPPNIRMPRKQLKSSELPPSFMTNVRYGHRINDRDLYPKLRVLYREFVRRAEEDEAGGRQFSYQEELDMWYNYLYPFSEAKNAQYLNYYEDMPPPRKIEEEELRDGWIDVPLYAADE